MIHHQQLSLTRRLFNFLTGSFIYLKLMTVVYLCLTLLILLICGLLRYYIPKYFYLQNKAVHQNVTTESDSKTNKHRLCFLCYWVRPRGSCHSPVLIFPRLLIPAPLACTRAWWATSLDSTRVCERRAREWESRTEELCVIFSYREKKNLLSKLNLNEL